MHSYRMPFPILELASLLFKISASTLYIFSLVCLSPAPNNASIFRILIYTHTPQIKDNTQSASNFVTSFIELEKNPALVETRKWECYLDERSRSSMVIVKLWKSMLTKLVVKFLYACASAVTRSKRAQTAALITLGSLSHRICITRKLTLSFNCIPGIKLRNVEILKCKIQIIHRLCALKTLKISIIERFFIQHL